MESLTGDIRSKAIDHLAAAFSALQFGECGERTGLEPQEIDLNLAQTVLNMLAMPAGAGTYDEFLQLQSGEEKESCAIVSLAFGFRLSETMGILPGKVNESLASITIDRVRECNRRRAGGSKIVTFAQFEIAQAMREDGFECFVDECRPIFNAEKGAPEYLSTAGVFKSLKSAHPEVKNVFIIGHHDHLPKIARISAGDNPETPLLCTFSDREKMPVFYDPGSAQSWTRSAFLFVLHEIASCADYEWKKLAAAR